MKATNKYFHKLLVFLMLPLLFSCQSLQPFYIDVLDPGKEELPKKIQSLTIVCQAVNNKYTTIDVDTLQKIFYKKDFNVDTILYDAQLADSSLTVLGDLLYQSGRYSYVIPEKRLIKPKPFSFLTGELDQNTVKSLCNIYNTDAVLSLDFLATKVSTKLHTASWWDDIAETETDGYEANIEIIYQALYRIYSPDEKKVIYKSLDVDTLNWSSSHPNLKTLFRNFITVKGALMETGVAISQKLTEKIANNWIRQKRYYYQTNNDNFVQAEKDLKRNRWKEAANNWKVVAESKKSKSLRSKAYFNLAFAYEVMGDIDTALQVAYKSYKLKYSSLTAQYLKTLDKRRKKINNIKK